MFSFISPLKYFEFKLERSFVLSKKKKKKNADVLITLTLISFNLGDIHMRRKIHRMLTHPTHAHERRWSPRCHWMIRQGWSMLSNNLHTTWACSNLPNLLRPLISHRTRECAVSSHFDRKPYTGNQTRWHISKGKIYIHYLIIHGLRTAKS